MPAQDKDLRSVNEIGKIYNSLTEKKALCDYFLMSVVSVIGADQGVLFLTGRDDQLWSESNTDPTGSMPEKFAEKGAKAYKNGKPAIVENILFTPLFVSNSGIGIACFIKESGKPAFEEKDLTLAFDLASQMAGSLKNILLFEQNLEMTRLSAVGQSMGMVLHEIKNIMQLATFAEEWLRRGQEKNNPKHLDRGIKGIQKAIHEMNGFVYEMLSLTKNYKIQPKPIQVANIIKELYEDLQGKADDSNIKLDFQVEDGFPEVLGEERSLYRAVLNLVKNSMEACDKEESWIRIRIQSKDKDYYDIILQDNGMGMSDEVKAKLLQAFFSTKGERGTGLGLMIVDRTLKAHHGKMKVDSEEGKGTTFTLTLPKVLKTETTET